MKIIQKDNEILRQKAKIVPLDTIGSKKIKKIIGRMKKILAESKDGVALAAPQIGESLRIFITKTPSDSDFKIFINPVIKKSSKNKKTVPEGCLSVEGVYGTIKRVEKLTVEADDEDGKKFICGASGLLAQIIQHEMDHLNGVLFIDKAERLGKYEKQD